MRKYSVIVPVYNRPEEVEELLDSLVRQTLVPHEVLIIEDGSTIKCEEIVKKFESVIPVKYFFKENSGQGFSRNYGFENASGDYFVVFDSDCIIPEHYFKTVDDYLDTHNLDAYGGPDRAREDFTSIQKAISYSMTSIVTTGGIRGSEKTSGTFHPRSFNMGIAKVVYEAIGGFMITRMGEDIEYSVRIIEAGYKSGLISEAYVYHKRRTSFMQFFRQLRFFGRARINVSRFYPDEIKLVHMLPLFFLLGEIGWVTGSFFNNELFMIGAAVNLLFIFLNFTLALLQYKSIWIASLGVVASYVQLLAYGTGLLTEGLKKLFS